MSTLGRWANNLPPFVHWCKPCDACGSSGDPMCETCSGRSTPCDCERRYDDEGDRRYRAWRDRQEAP